MAERALQPGLQSGLQPGQTVPRRRVLFGLLDADSWSWASLKALFWFVVIIMVLGYLPDRAYYFTVFSTIDLGLNVVSPVNICPSSNANLPCPAPAGAIVPWQPAPSQLNLPAGRSHGALVQSGSSLMFVGGSDGGGKAQPSVFATTLSTTGELSPWKSGVALPAPRSRAAAAFLAGEIYVVGGDDGSGKPTDSVYVGSPDAKTGRVTAWQAGSKLPAPRAALTLVALPDGLLALGGADAAGAPTATVWKATVDSSGKLGGWQPNGTIGDGSHSYPRLAAGGVLQGKNLYLFGGSDAHGPTAQVLHAEVGAGSNGQGVTSAWMVPTNASANLPAARTDAATFTANGALYVVGGSDGHAPQGDVYWTVPNANGTISSWSSMSQTNLSPALRGLAGAAAIPGGPNVFLVGGTTGAGGATAGVARADLDPKPPLLQLGLLGATIPAMGIQGEVGQQLGYLAAAGVGTVDFILLILIGLALTHPERTRELWQRFRSRRAAR